MKQAFLGLALAVAGIFCAPVASAQSSANGGDAAQAGVACLAGRTPGAFSALLGTPPYSAAERREATRLLPLIQRCTQSSGTLSTNLTLLRGIAAEDLYERVFRTAQAAGTPPLSVAALLRPGEARAPAEIEPFGPSYALAECLTAAHPDMVRAYLAVEAGGDAETAAFRALNPGLAACIPVGAPRRIGVNGATFRGILAEALYRWSVVQRDGASSPFAAGAATPAAAH